MLYKTCTKYTVIGGGGQESRLVSSRPSAQSGGRCIRPYIAASSPTVDSTARKRQLTTHATSSRSADSQASETQRTGGREGRGRGKGSGRSNSRSGGDGRGRSSGRQRQQDRQQDQQRERGSGSDAMLRPPKGKPTGSWRLFGVKVPAVVDPGKVGVGVLVMIQPVKPLDLADVGLIWLLLG